MSLDKLQSKPGLFSIMPEDRPGVGAYGASSTATTVASNMEPGGLNIGIIAGFAPGMGSNQAGGALWMQPVPWNATTTGSWGVSPSAGTDAITVSHYNAGMLGLNVTVTNALAVLQPPTYAGQHMWLVNQGSVSISFVSTGGVPNWSTTGTVTTATVTAQILEAAFSCNAGSARLLVANPFAVTTTNQWPRGLWKVLV